MRGPKSCLGCAARIADDIIHAIQPRAVRVEEPQNVRGGIRLVATAVRGSRP